MKRLIVNADDFGLSQGVNLGVVHGHRAGIVTSATLMVNMPEAREAFELARAIPSLGVGLHITLTGGRPVSSAGVDTLVGPDGRFRRWPALGEFADPDEVRREVRAQVDAFLASGLTPTHLDSHHHIHLLLPAAGAAVAEVARELGVPVRGPGFVGSFYGKDATTVDALLGILAALSDGVSEIMCHPAYLDPALLSATSYAAERVQELATLTDRSVRDALAAQEIELVNYRDLA